RSSRYDRADTSDMKTQLRALPFQGYFMFGHVFYMECGQALGNRRRCVSCVSSERPTSPRLTVHFMSNTAVTSTTNYIRWRPVARLLMKARRRERDESGRKPHPCRKDAPTPKASRPLGVPTKQRRP